MSILNDVTLINVFFCSQGDEEEGEEPRKKQLRQMFNRLAGDDNEIDSEELQDILTTSLKKGMAVNPDHFMIIIVCADKLVNVFDIAACRLMIAMLDVSFTNMYSVIPFIAPLAVANTVA